MNTQAIEKDALAMSIATAIKLANDTAAEHGMDLSECRVTVTEESGPPSRHWRVHYGPRDFVLRRGGDFIVIVDESKASVTQVLFGQ